MKVPFSWLKEYVDIEISPEELEKKLFSCGFEVEELVYLGKDVRNVVVGRIAACEKHPDADRLTVCRVDCGNFGEKQIVTAATNVFEGARVPVALDGATVLYEGGVQKIKTGKLRGVVSEGMFCSGKELGINDDFYEGAEVNGILILDEDAKAGSDIRPVVGIDDYIFDISVTANRPDCQSVLGIACEVAAVLGIPHGGFLPPCPYKATPSDVKFTVEVKEPALCPRYIGGYVKDVAIGKSPQWLRRRLSLCGMRSVNNIVDITNYVLLEVGQPMHAFDRKFLRGDKIVVRCAEEGEKIVTLDGKEFTLHPENLLICDAERPVALAGVMGGLNSEIREDTTEVFFEAASFARDTVRKTSRALGQRSDSSARFEKGVYPVFPHYGMQRALWLVQKLGCGTPASGLYIPNFCDKQEMPGKKIETTYSAIDSLLGICVPKEEVHAILQRLGFQVADMGASFTVKVPLWREDVDGWPDLAEEVIRMYGYEHIQPTFLEKAAVTHGGLTESQQKERRFKEVLAEEGYFEAVGYSFYSPKDFDLLRLPADAAERKAIVIKNPLGEDLSVMRTILAPTMLESVVRNVRRGNDEGRLFELANVFIAKTLPPEEFPEERKHLSVALWGEGDFFDLKGAFEAVAECFGLKFAYERGEKSYLHPGVSATVKMGEKSVGWLGELHPAIAVELALEKKVYLGELDYAEISAKFRKGIAVSPVPKVPAVRRDLAVVVGEKVTCAEIEGCILRACKAAKKAELFDVYRDARIGQDKKSMAFRITFAPDPAAEKPLAAETVEGFINKILNSLKYTLGAQLR